MWMEQVWSLCQSPHVLLTRLLLSFQLNLENLMVPPPPPIAPKPEIPKEECKTSHGSLLTTFYLFDFFWLFSSKPVSGSPSVIEEKVSEEEGKLRRRQEYVRTYVSPWERAMRGNEELTSTMRPNMPGPVHLHADLPLYKSFNRYLTFPPSQVLVWLP